MTRKTIARYGARRRSVRVFTEGALVRVQWRREGKLHTRSYPNTRAGQTDAKGFARGLADAKLTATAPRPTLRDIWTAYADDQFPHLRDRSRELYREYWTHWESMWGRGFVAEDTTRLMMTQFRKALDTRLSVTTVGETIRMVRRVYRWAEDALILGRNRIEGYRYKVAKEHRPESPDEYRLDEIVALLASFRPELASQWRPYVALAVCSYQGARQNAVLHLRWEDIDFEARRIHWRPEWDKVGKDRAQPLREPTIVALRAAEARRDGPWVFHAGSSKSRQATYSAQSLWAALRRAETRAGVVHRARRAMHGTRRNLAGEVNALTGDAGLAMQAIGDDIRQASRYLKPRDDRIEDAFAKLDAKPQETT